LALEVITVHATNKAASGNCTSSSSTVQQQQMKQTVMACSSMNLSIEAISLQQVSAYLMTRHLAQASSAAMVPTKGCPQSSKCNTAIPVAVSAFQMLHQEVTRVNKSAVELSRHLPNDPTLLQFTCHCTSKLQLHTQWLPLCTEARYAVRKSCQHALVSGPA